MRGLLLIISAGAAFQPRQIPVCSPSAKIMAPLPPRTIIRRHARSDDKETSPHKKGIPLALFIWPLIAVLPRRRPISLAAKRNRFLGHRSALTSTSRKFSRTSRSKGERPQRFPWRRSHTWTQSRSDAIYSAFEAGHPRWGLVRVASKFEYLQVHAHACALNFLSLRSLSKVPV